MARTPKTRPTRATSSSNVASHSYSPETEQLTVAFHSGRSYRYDGVDKDKAAEFERAASRGGFLHAHIIGKHDATEI